MDTPLIYEIIGYVASVLVAISLTMSRIVRLRVVNLAGAVTFALYGVLIGSIPVAAVNTFIVGVNLWYLFRIYRSREFFRLLPVGRDNEYLQVFLDFYRDDIARFQPEFAGLEGGDEDVLHIFVLRDLVPAGLLVGEVHPPGQLEVALDYVTPDYRDFKVGRFLFRDQADHFRRKGIQEIRSRPGTREHSHYLERMGFRREGEGYRFPLE
ncbi:MAG: hypothetical protein EA422_11575 [Gemmatimonadales bacterium]|nr:MAG: hypothetical protein EA422_11575 [Gemmatimonadales bacterium]